MGIRKHARVLDARQPHRRKNHRLLLRAVSKGRSFCFICCQLETMPSGRKFIRSKSPGRRSRNRSRSRRMVMSGTRKTAVYRSSPGWTPIATITDPEKRRQMLVQRNMHSELDLQSVSPEKGLDFAYLGTLHTVLHDVLKTWPVFDVSNHVAEMTRSAISSLQRDPFSEQSIPPIPKNKRVLIVGCGRGIHVLDIAVSTSHDVEIVAVDANADKIAATRSLLKRFPEVNQRVTLIQKNIHELTLEPRFHMILDANVIHYMAKILAAHHVQNMVDLLETNGHLFMFWQPNLLKKYRDDTFLNHLKPRPDVRREWASNEGIGVRDKGLPVQFTTSDKKIQGAAEIRSIHFQKPRQ